MSFDQRDPADRSVFGDRSSARRTTYRREHAMRVEPVRGVGELVRRMRQDFDAYIKSEEARFGELVKAAA